MSHPHYDLDAASREEMQRNGFDVEFPETAADQLADLQRARPNFAGLKDLRHLLWSSIDNDSSRDLDQVEVCSQEGRNIRVLIGIADVDFAIPRDTPIDRHAASQTTSVYTATRVYPMLPTAISTDLTSLNEGVDRAGIVVEMLIAPDGQIAESSVYQALLHNGAQLTYNAVGPLVGRACSSSSEGYSVARIAGTASYAGCGGAGLAGAAPQTRGTGVRSQYCSAGGGEWSGNRLGVAGKESGR